MPPEAANGCWYAAPTVPLGKLPVAIKSATGWLFVLLLPPQPTREMTSIPITERRSLEVARGLIWRGLR
jgi:hypothetical protein